MNEFLENSGGNTRCHILTTPDFAMSKRSILLRNSEPGSNFVHCYTRTFQTTTGPDYHSGGLESFCRPSDCAPSLVPESIDFERKL